MDPAVATLFTPVSIGSLTLKNRLVMAPMGTNLASWTGAVTDRLIRYYAERARGGVALITAEFSNVHPSGRASPYTLGIFDDAQIPGLRQLTQAIHDGGARAAIQIAHSGRRVSTAVLGAQPVAPSPIPYIGGEVPRALDLAEIADVARWYVQAARRARDAGFDAVMLHIANGYLLNQFISPYANKRTDRYGGSTEGRARLPLEIAEGIRRELGPHFPIIARLCVAEFIDNGLTLDESKVIAHLLEQAGADAIEVIAGIPETQYIAGPPMAMPRGFLVPLARAIKEQVSIPVMAVGRINDPLLAERILREGSADIISMARAFLADPELPRKAMEGRFDDIRPCIACQEGCSRRLFSGLDISCTVNPRVAREVMFALEPAARPKRVLVAGGGPGGMMAALTAVQRGHTVTLCEQGPGLGGQLLLGTVPPHKEEIGHLVEYLVGQVRKSGVEVKVGTRVTADLVRQLAPDALVVAVGARPVVPPIPGLDRDAVTALDVLSGSASAGDRVVVVGGGEVGCEVAELLATRGRQVTILEMLRELAADMETRGRRLLLQRLAQLDVQALTQCTVTTVEGGAVWYERAGLRHRLDGVDTVVVAVGMAPQKELQAELEGLVGEVYAIGDCVRPRRILEAVREGFEIGFSI